MAKAKATPSTRPRLAVQPSVAAVLETPIVQTTLPLVSSFIGGVGLISRGIERLSFGPLSHVDTERVADGWLYGARSDRWSGKVDGKPLKVGKGVQWRPPGYYGHIAKRVTMTLQVPQAIHNAYWTALTSQKGKPYNALGILGMLVNQNWRAPDSWYCSELVGWAGEEAKLYPKLYTPTDRVTPVEVAMLWSGLGAKVQEMKV